MTSFVGRLHGRFIREANTAWILLGFGCLLRLASLVLLVEVSIISAISGLLPMLPLLLPSSPFSWRRSRRPGFKVTDARSRSTNVIGISLIAAENSAKDRTAPGRALWSVGLVVEIGPVVLN